MGVTPGGAPPTIPPVSSSITLRALALGGAMAVCACSPALAQTGSSEGTDQAAAQSQPPAEEAPAARGPQPQPNPDPNPDPDPGPDGDFVRINLSLSGVSRGKVDVGRRFKVVGKVFPFVRRQKVNVYLKRDSKVIMRRKVDIDRIPGRDAGRFSVTSKRIIKPGTYRFRARKNQTAAQDGATAGSIGVEVDYPDLDPGDRGRDVKLFNELLDKQAYHGAKGSRYDSKTGLAVMAYRKVNNMPRTSNATPGIFETLADGKGGFRLKWPEGGKHVEADLSRQVMVLANKGKAKHIFHISSGTPATPTVRGKYATYRKDYGTNSLGMIHSVYFHRGYATHGYHSVPTYPASHGCLRNPPVFAKFIYDWINIGDVFYVYG